MALDGEVSRYCVAFVGQGGPVRAALAARLLLVLSTVGTLEFRNVAEPVRREKFGVPLEFHQAEVVSVDASAKKVTCKVSTTRRCGQEAPAHI